MEYYSIPFAVDQVMNGKHMADEVEIRKAIHENIRLILKTFLLSYRFDPLFGSVMNKFHANTPPQGKSERVWREKIREEIRKNMKLMLQKYETRVKVSDVNIDLRHPKNRKRDSVMNVKIEISGQLTIGRKDKFHYPDSEVTDEAQEIFPLMIPVGKPRK